jgi:heptosyltransferase-3
MKGVLVWHQGAIGDLVLSLPAVYSIKRHFHAHSLHLISKSELSDIVIAGRIADEVSSNERALYADFFCGSGMSGPAADFLEKFEAAFVFVRRRNDAFMSNLLRHVLSCCDVCTVPPEGVKEHVAGYQLKQLADRGIRPALLPELDAGRRYAEIDAGEPIISMHPGSGGKEKRWHLRGFLDLMETLAEEGRYRFFILLGPAEADMESECRGFISGRNISAEIVSNRPVSFIAPILKASSLYVGNDSGITHLASVLGAPTLAIFGPTDPAVWGPIGSSVRIIRPACSVSSRRGFSGLRPGSVDVEDVAKAAMGLLLAGHRQRGTIPYSPC